MASTATLLSSALALLPPSPASSHRSSTSSSNGGVKLLASSRGGVVSSEAQSQWAWRQLGKPQARAGGRRRCGVVCEVAVELGGSRSSEGEGEKETETEKEKKVEAGTRIRVLGPLKVYHVPKNPELDIGGMEGEVKEVVTTFKGKPVSATYPYKVQLVTQGEESRKFFVHLKDDEFEVLE